MSYEDAQASILNLYREDFDSTVRDVLPRFLFSEGTLEPLFKTDVRALARQVSVPVRAINADYTPTCVETNQRYFGDYGAKFIALTGHYPMLERPTEFNGVLSELLDSLDHTRPRSAALA